MLALAAASIGGVALTGCERVADNEPAVSVAAPAVERPPLALLTSLPLVFGEEFGIEAPRSAVLDRLEQVYRVKPVGVADAASLEEQRLLLMAHPRAQPAQVLVELDAWVRGGGKVLLLADPKLDWPSERPLGDRLRPPIDFADTGLLGRWGLRLEGPIADGPRIGDGGGYDMMLSSPGALSATGSSCRIEQAGLIARCRVGAGAVTVLADADFLNVSGDGALDGPVNNNLTLLMAELSRLQSR